jgi:hypothetical protein
MPNVQYIGKCTVQGIKFTKFAKLIVVQYGLKIPVTINLDLGIYFLNFVPRNFYLLLRPISPWCRKFIAKKVKHSSVN